MKRYGLKIFFKSVVSDEVFFEESVVCLKAKDFDDAYERAALYAKNRLLGSYLNMYGEEVSDSVFDIVDCFEIFDEETCEVQEIYSCYKKNRTDMSEQEFVDFLSDGCSEEELYPLREMEFNGTRKKTDKE